MGRPAAEVPTPHSPMQWQRDMAFATISVSGTSPATATWSRCSCSWPSLALQLKHYQKLSGSKWTAPTCQKEEKKEKVHFSWQRMMHASNGWPCDLVKMARAPSGSGTGRPRHLAIAKPPHQGPMCSGPSWGCWAQRLRGATGKKGSRPWSQLAGWRRQNCPWRGPAPWGVRLEGVAGSGGATFAWEVCICSACSWPDPQVFPTSCRMQNALQDGKLLNWRLSQRCRRRIGCKMVWRYRDMF